MISKGVMQVSLTTVAVAPASAAPAKPFSALLPSHRLAASYTAKRTACDSLFRGQTPPQHQLSRTPLDLEQCCMRNPAAAILEDRRKTLLALGANALQ